MSIDARVQTVIINEDGSGALFTPEERRQLAALKERERLADKIDRETDEVGACLPDDPTLPNATPQAVINGQSFEITSATQRCYTCGYQPSAYGCTPEKCKR